MTKTKRFVIKVPTNRTKVVAIRSLSDPTVVAHGTKAAAVYKKASQGQPESFRPILVHVPQKDTNYIF